MAKSKSTKKREEVMSEPEKVVEVKKEKQEKKEYYIPSKGGVAKL